MKGLQKTNGRQNEVLALQCRGGDARSAGPVLLEPFSAGLPPELLERLWVATSRLRLGSSEIVACAIALFPHEEGL